jgi:hypothetical protein
MKIKVYNKISQTSTIIPSTSLIEDIREKALLLSESLGKGIKLEIDAIKNHECRNCNIHLKMRLE